jgi:hypothetical protein
VAASRIRGTRPVGRHVLPDGAALSRRGPPCGN